MTPTVLRLRPATPDDRRAIFEGLARSDVTDRLLGHPSRTSTPLLSWEAFIADYRDHFFDGSAPELGRCFILEVAGAVVGQASHSEVVRHAETIHPGDAGADATEVDIWMFAERHCGRGFGTAGLRLLCDLLQRERGVTGFLLRPSASNARAIRSYEKAGFRRTTLPAAEVVRRFGPDDVPDPVHLARGLVPGDGAPPEAMPPEWISRRPATDADRDETWAALRAAYRDIVIRVFGAWDNAAIRGDFESKWAVGGFEVVAVGGRFAGAIWVSDEGAWTRLREVFLLPAAQGRGVGSALVRDEIARARHAARPLRLRVLRQSRARALYERLGFTPRAGDGEKVWMELG